MSFFPNNADKYSQWVYACVSTRAEKIAKLKLILEEKKGKTWQRVEDQETHPIIQPLNKVNNFMTFAYLIQATSSFLDLTGGAFWVLFRSPSGQVREIWPLFPHLTRVIKDSTNFITGYDYTVGGRTIRLPVKDVVYMYTFNPNNFTAGTSIITASQLSIETDSYAQQWNRHFFLNNAMPATIVKYPGAVKKEQLELIRSQWNALFQGVTKAGSTAFIGEGGSIERLNLSQKDMDYLEQRRFSRDEILAMFKVPKTLLGIVEDVNRANAEATRYSFAVDVVDPRMDFITSALNEIYIPRAGVKGQYRFTYESPVPGNRELLLKERETGVRMGWLTINEIRAEEGKAPIKGGDVAYMNGLAVGQMQEVKTKMITAKSYDRDVTLMLNKLATPPTEDAKIEAQKVRSGELIKSRVSYMRDQIKTRKVIFAKIIQQLGQDIVTKLKETKTIKATREQVSVIVDDSIEIFYDATQAEVDDALRDALSYGGNQTLAQLDIDSSFDLQNPRVVAWLRENGLAHARSVADTFKVEVLDLIVGGVDQGTAIADIADSIVGYFDERTPWKSLMIARTEIIAGYAQGSLEGAKQSNVVNQKKWLNAGDDKVSDWDIENQNKGWVDIDFADYEGSFGGGIAAPASHPNCRCTLLYK